MSLAAFISAMLSKGSAVILPVVLLAVAWWLRPMGADTTLGSTKIRFSPFIRREFVRTMPFFLIAAALAAVNMWFQTHGAATLIRSATFIQRLLGAGCVPWFYLYKAIVPLDLAFVYPQWRIEAGNPLFWLPGLAVLAVTAMLCLYERRWSRPILFAWVFFCASLVPVMGFADVGFMKHSLVADHYQHIAIIGVIALVAAGLGLWRERAKGAIPQGHARWSLLRPPAALALLAWRQSSLYADALTLYKVSLEKNPHSWMIQNDMGKKLFEKGRINEAVGYYQAAITLNADFPEPYYNLGLVLYGKPASLWRQSKSTSGHLHYAPDYPEILNNMGNAMIQTSQARGINRILPESPAPKARLHLGAKRPGRRIRPNRPSFGCGRAIQRYCV